MQAPSRQSTPNGKPRASPPPSPSPAFYLPPPTLRAVDRLGDIPGSGETQIAVCAETVEWCRREKRSFLRIRVQLRLSALLLAAMAPVAQGWNRRKGDPARLLGRALSSPTGPRELFTMLAIACTAVTAPPPH